MLNNSIILQQQQIISANQIQSLEILTLTNYELEYFMTKEYLENPMLESTFRKDDEAMTNLDNLYQRDFSSSRFYNPEHEEFDRKLDLAANEPNALRDAILGQLNEKDYTRQEWELFYYLIECLDEDGFFTFETKQIANALGTPKAMVGRCLDKLKALEPVGIFCSGTVECLKRQLTAKNIDDKALFTILDFYMTDLLNGRIGNISRKLKLKTAQIKEYIHLIGSLNPRPFMNVFEHKPQYIIPDILVSRQGNVWAVKLNDNFMGQYKFNDYYIQMMQSSHDEELISYFKEKLERARFLMSCVEQRRNTIIRIVEAILNEQTDYFLRGEPLKTMTMETIAQKTDMHISTVSRAIKDKYLQFRKTESIRDLFSKATDADGSYSVDEVKLKIKTLIRAEDPKKPYSDSRLTSLILAEGVKISRRTVTKYRENMGILDSRQRGYL